MLQLGTGLTALKESEAEVRSLEEQLAGLRVSSLRLREGADARVADVAGKTVARLEASIRSLEELAAGVLGALDAVSSQVSEAESS